MGIGGNRVARQWCVRRRGADSLRCSSLGRCGPRSSRSATSPLAISARLASRVLEPGQVSAQVWDALEAVVRAVCGPGCGYRPQRRKPLVLAPGSGYSPECCDELPRTGEVTGRAPGSIRAATGGDRACTGGRFRAPLTMATPRPDDSPDSHRAILDHVGAAARTFFRSCDTARPSYEAALKTRSMGTDWAGGSP